MIKDEVEEVFGEEALEAFDKILLTREHDYEDVKRLSQKIKLLRKSTRSCIGMYKSLRERKMDAYTLGEVEELTVWMLYWRSCAKTNFGLYRSTQRMRRRANEDLNNKNKKKAA